MIDNDFQILVEKDRRHLRRLLKKDQRDVARLAGFNVVVRGRLTPKQKDFIFKRDKGRCRGCGTKLRRGRDDEFDHNKSVSRGGKTTLRNMILLCRKCNRLKRTGTLSDLKRKLKNLRKYGKTKVRKSKPKSIYEKFRNQEKKYIKQIRSVNFYG